MQRHERSFHFIIIFEFVYYKHTKRHLCQLQSRLNLFFSKLAFTPLTHITVHNVFHVSL